MSADLPNGIMPSIIDRLIDPESAGTGQRPGYTEAQMLRSVQRDLAELLNTRRPSYVSLGIEELAEVQTSVLTYGLPDFAAVDPTQRQRIDEIGKNVGEEIKSAIERFEPRLRDVVVTAKDPDDVRKSKGDRNYKATAVYFHISGKLKMDPSPELAFDTVLELTAGCHKIEGSTT